MDTDENRDLASAGDDNGPDEREHREAEAVERAAPVATLAAGKPWFRRPGTLAVIGLLAAALIAALVFAVGRDSSPSGTSGSAGKTIQAYFSENDITATPVRRGEPGAPVITFALPKGWSDAGPDTPKDAYGAAFYDNSVDPEYPPSVVVLLSKLAGDADAAKILQYAPGELEALPDYTVVSEPETSTLSGFEAVQLGGHYTRKDGVERIIAQKTVVIPAQDALYVLQMNVDVSKAEGPVLQGVTGSLDESAKIAP